MAMKLAMVLGLACAAPLPGLAEDAPLGRALALITGLHADVSAEGGVASTAHAHAAVWCQEKSSNLSAAVTRSKAYISKLQGASSQADHIAAVLAAKREQLGHELRSDEAGLRNASGRRAGEAVTFAAAEMGLMQTLALVERVSEVLGREAKSSTPAARSSGAHELDEDVRALVKSSWLDASDAKKLASVFQKVPIVNDGECADVTNTLQLLRDHIHVQLETQRSKEETRVQKFKTRKRTTESRMEVVSGGLQQVSESMAQSERLKALATSDLGGSLQELAAESEALDTVGRNCSARDADYQAEAQIRLEELAALAKAMNAVKNTAGSGALAQVSTSQPSARKGSAAPEAELVRGLAERRHSQVLELLAAQISVANRAGGLGGEQVRKARHLVLDAMARLQAENAAEASEKAWCDAQVARAQQRHDMIDIRSLIEQLSARASQLKAEVVSTQEDIVKEAASQKEMDQAHQDESHAHSASKSLSTRALEGVNLAMQVLGDFYAREDRAHGHAAKAARGILGVLEQCKSGFSQELGLTASEEGSALAEYRKVAEAAETERAAREQEMERKIMEARQLNEDAAALVAGGQAKLPAVLASFAKVGQECASRMGAYGQQRAFRASELLNIEEALALLHDGDEVPHLNSGSARRKLRGASPLGD